jgi:hypothetical protein
VEFNAPETRVRAGGRRGRNVVALVIQWWTLTRSAARMGQAIARTATVPLRHRIVHAAPGVTFVVEAVRAAALAGLRAASDEARERGPERGRR